MREIRPSGSMSGTWRACWSGRIPWHGWNTSPMRSRLIDMPKLNAAHHYLYSGPACIVRNIIFLVIVLLHGFRRLLPPY